MGKWLWGPTDVFSGKEHYGTFSGVEDKNKLVSYAALRSFIFSLDKTFLKCQSDGTKQHLESFDASSFFGDLPSLRSLKTCVRVPSSHSAYFDLSCLVEK